MNIMVMAGTSDANQVIEGLKNQPKIDIRVTATTVTSQGALLALEAGADKVISRPLNQDEIVKTLREEKADYLVDATHPFASEATYNAIGASEYVSIPYFRFERPKTFLPKNDLIYTVTTFQEAAQLGLDLTTGNIFHLAGVSTLNYLTEFIKTERIVVRVLPSIYSIKKCRELGLPAENIIAMQGTFSKDFNQTMMKEYFVEVVITKDSGKTGGTPEKIEAALELGIPVIVVQRPEIPELKLKKVFRSVKGLMEEILD